MGARKEAPKPKHVQPRWKWKILRDPFQPPMDQNKLVTMIKTAGMVDNQDDADRVVRILQDTPGIVRIERIGAAPVYQFKYKFIVMNPWTESFFSGLIQGVVQAVESGVL